VRLRPRKGANLSRGPGAEGLPVEEAPGHFNPFDAAAEDVRRVFSANRDDNMSTPVTPLGKPILGPGDD